MTNRSTWVRRTVLVLAIVLVLVIMRTAIFEDEDDRESSVPMAMSELMLQLVGGSVFQGPGNYLGGAAAVLRYNFVQPEAKWVPYMQLGAGALYNDIYKDREQRLIGKNWELDLEATLGIRYFFNDRWSANLEGGYRHISNANSNDRNVGLNSLGGGVGLGYHF
jgi:lipid A 3-O-deacylase